MSKREMMIQKLTELYERHPEEILALLPVKAVNGRRILLAKTKEEIEDSGRSTGPRNIAKPGYISVWACSNGSGPQYALLPCWVMDKLGYSDSDIASFVKKFIQENAYQTG